MKKTKRKSWLSRKAEKELKRIVEYMVAGGVWFWSGYVIIVFSYEHIGLFAANFIGNADNSECRSYEEWGSPAREAS